MPHLLLSAAKVIVFSEYSKRKALFCVFFLIKTEFYFVFYFIWCIFVAMMMKKSSGRTASEGIAVDAR